MKRRDFLKALIALPIASFFYPLPFNPEKLQEIESLILLDTVVAGYQYYKGEKIWQNLRVNQNLKLVREHENPYDRQAIEIYRLNKKLGYIPKAGNPVIARMMNNGMKLKAKITWLKQSEDQWERVGIKVEMEA